MQLLDHLMGTDPLSKLTGLDQHNVGVAVGQLVELQIVEIWRDGPKAKNRDRHKKLYMRLLWEGIESFFISRKTQASGRGGVGEWSMGLFG